MSREQSFNIIRTVVSRGVAIAVAFIIILLISAERFLHKYRQNWIEKEAKA